MRVIFHDPHAADGASFEAFGSRVNEFWAQAQAPEDARAFSQRVAQLSPQLFGNKSLEADGSQLLLVRAKQRAQRPLARFVMSRAPELPRLIYARLAPPLPLQQVLPRILTKYAVDFKRARVRIGFARGHLLELQIHLPGADAQTDFTASARALVQGLLGERLFDDWVGKVSVVPAPAARALPVFDSRRAADAPLADLLPLCERGIRALKQGLATAPLRSYKPTSEWTMFEAEPETREDWPEQADLVFASTWQPELLKCFLSGSPFSSCRFSNFEHFAYLKYQTAKADALVFRQKLEDDLDHALREQGLGAVIGNGQGLRYSYVSFGVTQLAEAFWLLRQLARKAHLPERSWLLCCDTDFAQEWLGIWPGTPAPPRYTE